MSKFEKAVVVFLFCALVALLPGACTTTVQEAELDVSVYYEVIEIEGMPCVLMSGVGGLSCDWSRWRGE